MYSPQAYNFLLSLLIDCWILAQFFFVFLKIWLWNCYQNDFTNKRNNSLWFFSILFKVLFQCYNCSKPLWEVIAYMVSNVPLPTPGKDRVLFAVENCLLSVDAPPEDGLPQADVWALKSDSLGLLWFSSRCYKH